MSVDDANIMIDSEKLEEKRRGRPRKVVSPLTPNAEGENFFQNMIGETDDSTVVHSNRPKAPPMSSPEWSDFLLSQLEDDEKDDVNGYPKTEGLKRLATIYVGDIISSESHIYSASPEFAAVKHTLIFRCGEDIQKEYAGVADAVPGNPPYDRFLTAIASTRALGRALRDALRLKNVVVAEEVGGVAVINNATSSTPSQRAGINKICNDLNISVQKIVKLFDAQVECVEDLSRDLAAKIMGKLNSYQQGKEQVPVDVLKENK